MTRSSDADKIQEGISGGKVILHGSVGSWADYEEAEYVAYCAPSVPEVQNKLTVTGKSKQKYPVSTFSSFLG
jgi:osmotically-inducible protein OsmY